MIIIALWLSLMLWKQVMVAAIMAARITYDLDIPTRFTELFTVFLTDLPPLFYQPLRDDNNSLTYT